MAGHLPAGRQVSRIAILKFFVGVGGIELPLKAPHALVLPLYYTPIGYPVPKMVSPATFT